MNTFTSFLHTCSSSYLRLISLTSFYTAFLPTSPKDRLNRLLPVLQLQVFFLYWLISINIYTYSGASQVVLVVKNLPASTGDIRHGFDPWVGKEGPLEEGMATHCSILAWRIPWTEEPSRLQSMGSQRIGHD